MTIRLPVTIVPEPERGPGGEALEISEAIRVINQNFRAVRDLIERGAIGGTLLAPGSVDEIHLSTDAKTLTGDVTGTIGASGATVVADVSLLTTRGDMIRRSASGAERFGIGATNTLLRSDGNDPDWATLSALIDAALGSTRGQMLRRGASAWEVVSIGADDTLLTSDGTDPAWETLTSLLDSLFSNSQGAILHRGAAGWTALAPGTAGYVLETGGAGADPSWEPATGGSPPTDFDLLTDGVSSLIFAGGDVVWIT